MSKTKFISIRNQAESTTLEIFFLDVIQDTYDWWTGMMYSKVQEIIDKINYYKPTKIKIIIDSIGGDAQTGISIYNFLKRSDIKVEVEVIGLAGSIASVLMQAANKGKRRIAKNGFVMIHKAEGGVLGTADEVRAGAQVIELYDDQIADIYVQNNTRGKSAEEIKALYAAGDFWMTGEQAVELGFADEIFNEVTSNIQIAARLDSSDYKNIPEAIRAQLKPTPENNDSTDNKTFFENQFTEMKKFFTEIVNSIRGVKPAEGTSITNQIADAVQAPFEKLGDEMDTEITNKVDTALKADTVTTVITNKVNDAVAAIDFTKDGAPKTAVENAAKLVIENALAADGENPIKAAFDKAVNAKVETVVAEKTKDLETEITNMKGKPTNSGNNQPEGAKVVGKFNKG